MNILYLAHRVPFPPDKGDKLRSFRQIECLAKRHDVWCACFADDEADVRYATHLRGYCRDVAVFSLRPFVSLARGAVALAFGGTVTEGCYSCRRMRNVMRTWCQSTAFDAVVAFSSSMAQYALWVPARRRVLDLCDLDSQKWLAYARKPYGLLNGLYRLEGNRLHRLECAWVDRFDATILATEEEAGDLRCGETIEKLHVVGNGVALPDCAETIGVSDAAAVAMSSQRPTVGFVGTMNYRPNVDAACWFVESCWPRIRRECPSAEFRIVGRSPTRRVRRLEAVPGVRVIGPVGDIVGEVQNFDVSVAPLRVARGIQNKVLEAMATAKPVVLTSAAARGIPARHGEEFLVADAPDAISAAVVDLLRHPGERRRLGWAARRFVGRHHRWDDVLRRFEHLITGTDGRILVDKVGDEPPASRPPYPDSLAEETGIAEPQAFANA